MGIIFCPIEEEKMIFWRFHENSLIFGSQKISLTLRSQNLGSNHLFQKMVEVCQGGMLEE